MLASRRFCRALVSLAVVVAAAGAILWRETATSVASYGALVPGCTPLSGPVCTGHTPPHTVHHLAGGILMGAGVGLLAVAITIASRGRSRHERTRPAG